MDVSFRPPILHCPLRSPYPLPYVLPPALSETGTSGARGHSYQTLGSGQSTSPGGKTARFRHSLPDILCAPSSSLAVPCAEPDVALHSSPEALLPAIAVSSSSVGYDDVEPDDPVGQPLLPLGHPLLPISSHHSSSNCLIARYAKISFRLRSRRQLCLFDYYTS